MHRVGDEVRRPVRRPDPSILDRREAVVGGGVGGAVVESPAGEGKYIGVAQPHRAEGAGRRRVVVQKGEHRLEALIG